MEELTGLSGEVLWILSGFITFLILATIQYRSGSTNSESIGEAFIICVICGPIVALLIGFHFLLEYIDTLIARRKKRKRNEK